MCGKLIKLSLENRLIVIEHDRQFLGSSFLPQ